MMLGVVETLYTVTKAVQVLTNSKKPARAMAAVEAVAEETLDTIHLADQSEMMVLNLPINGETVDLEITLLVVGMINHLREITIKIEVATHLQEKEVEEARDLQSAIAATKQVTLQESALLLEEVVEVVEVAP
jgi:hypothetical protein